MNGLEIWVGASVGVAATLGAIWTFIQIWKQTGTIGRGMILLSLGIVLFCAGVALTYILANHEDYWPFAIFGCSMCGYGGCLFHKGYEFE